MRKTLFLLLLALIAAPVATAGGWATAGVSPLPTAGSPGSEQTFTITILRHGKTPTDGATPVVILTGQDGQKLRFPATPSGQVGKYTATVNWPAAGTWGFAVNDGLEATRYGMSQTHTFKAVSISGTTGSSDFISPDGLGLLLFVGLGLALVVWRLYVAKALRPAKAA